MKHLWQRKDNPKFTKGEFKLSSPYKPYEKVAIAVFFIVFFPVFLVIYPIYKLIIGAALVTAQFAFYLQHKLFSGKKSAPHSIFQFVRSYISTLASRIPHINCGVRKWLYKLSGIKIGGKNVFVGGFGVFDDVAPENVVIEDHATISFDVTIVAHGPRPSIKDDSEKMVIFREYSYVGAGTLILPGVEIGTYAIVGAGSVVTKDVPPGAVVGGAPARILYYREGWGPDGKIE